MLKESLKTYFSFDEFRPGQEEIIQAIINKKNVLAVMPTGAGKSLCYQLPALLAESYSIIISPLISLMQDQVESLNKSKLTAAFVNSTLDFRETEKVLNSVQANKIKMLFIAPEKLNNPMFVERIRNSKPEYLFVDEAHCISEWGHNFRPSFRSISTFADLIGIKNVSAFTATATPEVRKDIIEQLNFDNPSIHITGFERHNISLHVRIEKDKKQKIYELLQHNKLPSIIYTSTRKYAEQLTKYLKLKKINVEFYHAGISNEMRRIVQDDFISDRVKVIVATNAFGMGIDKQDINLVIHYNIPGSIENLYQEFGRAGRNGSESMAYLFFTDRDKQIQDYFISSSYPTYEQIKNCYNAVLDFHRIAINSISEKLLDIDEKVQLLITQNNVPKNLIPSILGSLESNGYLKLHSSNSIHHSIKFILKQEELKKYLKGMYNPDLQEFVVELVRHFGNAIFTSKVKLNFEFFEISFGQSRQSLENFLMVLNNVGIIEYDKPSFAQKIQMLQERVESNRLRLKQGEIENKIEHAKQKLKKSIDYVYSKECRFKYILDYFGEKTENYKCGKCDNCLKESSKNPSAEYINEIIIRTFKEFKGSLTNARLIGILKGSSKSVVAKKISTYQNCKHYSVHDIESSIQSLIMTNILKEINDELFFNPMEELFSIDDEVIEEQQVVKISYEENLELFNKLNDERSIAAKKFSQYSQMICSDKLLKEIAKSKPKTPSELMSINGFNQRMYNKIGEEFLSIITEFVQSERPLESSIELPQHISQTNDLVKKGYSFTEIAKLLKLPESIVSIQLETIIRYYPKQNYSSLLDKSEFEIIKSAIHDINEDLKNIKSKLSPKISYSKIRVVKAIISAK